MLGSPEAGFTASENSDHVCWDVDFALGPHEKVCKQTFMVDGIFLIFVGFSFTLPNSSSGASAGKAETATTSAPSSELIEST